MSNLTILKQWSRWRRRVRGIASDDEGVAAIEFAVVGPVFFLAVIGLIEISMIILISILLEGGIRDSARFGLTGQDGDGGLSRDEQIIQSIRDATLGMVELEPSQIETLVYQSFADIGEPEAFIDGPPFNGTYDAGEAYTDSNANGQWDEDQGTPGSGGADDIVLYRVTAQWAALTPLFAPFLGEDGIIDLQASVAIRNEPF